MAMIASVAPASDTCTGGGLKKPGMPYIVLFLMCNVSWLPALRTQSPSRFTLYLGVTTIFAKFSTGATAGGVRTT